MRLRPVVARAVLLILISTTVSLVGLEIALRVRPTLLGDDFANGAVSKYTTREGGIFYRDRNLRMLFLIPGVRTRMSYNGYTWTHETDAYGFRNRSTPIRADAMLLGDSLIYGHGVEFESTVAHRLERLTGLSVVNLARQGDCSFQEAYLLTQYIPIFRPRVVFYAFYENDITDLDAYLSRDEMQAFVDEPVEKIRYPARVDPAQALRERDSEIRRRALLRRIEDSAYLAKAYRWLKWRLRVGRNGAQPSVAQAEVNDETSLQWKYTKKAIAYMQHVAERHGAELVVVPITPFSPRPREILRAVAADQGLPFLDTSALTIADASLWLPGDGHFSPAGAERLAEILAAHVRRKGPGLPPSP